MSIFEIGHIVSGVMACILIYVYEKFRRPGKLNTESNIYLLYVIAGYMSFLVVLFIIILSEMCFIFGWDFSNILSSIGNRRRKMNHEKVICPVCKKSVRSVLKTVVETMGMCDECYSDSFGLVKEGNYYVPYNYRNSVHYEWVDKTIIAFSFIKNEHSTCNEDYEARLPEISHCKKYNKWKLTFLSEIHDGLDTVYITRYFDNKEDIIDALIGKDKD